MKSWKNTIISKNATVKEAIAQINASSMQLAMVLDSEQRLEGLITDGDIRRAILDGFDLNTPVFQIMNTNPVTASVSLSKTQLISIMMSKELHHVPLIDDMNRVVNLATIDLLAEEREKPNWVVLMAGGLGTRLKPLTDACPKPMLPIHGKPILENIIENFSKQGFRKIFLSVNYLSETIRHYFGDGSKYEVNIEYLHEFERLGTAGALSLLPESPTHPLIVMNADLLTNMSFDQMLLFHAQHEAIATMAVREYDIKVPYGLIQLDGVNISSIEEKPTCRFFVNAGIYILSPDCLKSIPTNSFFDMPNLFKRFLKTNRVCAYPIHEYWIDIGRIEEFERAQSEWALEKKEMESG